jgi:intron-binding protein aquarius
MLGSFSLFAGLRKHDVCFIVTVKAQMSPYDQFDWNRPFVPQVGLAYVRGCEIEGMLDEEGRVIEEGPEPKPRLPGKNRTFRVWLDTNQYQLDMADVVQGKEDVYETFNIFMRRKPKENNFKVLYHNSHCYLKCVAHKEIKIAPMLISVIICLRHACH